MNDEELKNLIASVIIEEMRWHGGAFDDFRVAQAVIGKLAPMMRGVIKEYTRLLNTYEATLKEYEGEGSDCHNDSCLLASEKVLASLPECWREKTFEKIII